MRRAVIPITAAIAPAVALSVAPARAVSHQPVAVRAGRHSPGNGRIAFREYFNAAQTRGATRPTQLFDSAPDWGPRPPLTRLPPSLLRRLTSRAASTPPTTAHLLGGST
jgi:hypothetical protein